MDRIRRGRVNTGGGGTLREIPRTYTFIGRRLIKELYQQVDAARPWKVDKISVKPPIINVDASNRSEPHDDNWFPMTRKVAKAIDDLTGSLLDPGDYVRADVLMRWKVVSMDDHPEFAWFFGEEKTDEGPVYLVLFGSAKNFHGYTPREDKGWSGWSPSTGPGTATLIARALAALRTQPTREHLERNDALEVTNVSTADLRQYTASSALGTLPTTTPDMRDAIGLSGLLSERGRPDGESVKDVLFSVSDSAGPFPSGDGREPIARIYLGTPLWVADPMPKRDTRIAIGRP